MNPRSIVVLSLAVLLGGCTNGYYMSGNGFTVRTPEIRLATSGDATSGSWSGRLGQMEGRADPNSNFFFSINIDADGPDGGSAGAMTSVHSVLFLIPSKAVDGPISGSIVSDAGTLRMAGRVVGEKVAGTWAISPNPGFMALFNSKPPVWAVMNFIFSDVKLGRVQAFQAALGGGLSAKEVLRLSTSGMEPDYAAELVRGGMPREVDGLVRLRNAGVPAEMPGKLKEAGYEFGPQDIVRLRNSGMPAEDAAAWKSAGFNFTAADLVRLRNSGLRPEFGTAVKEAGRDFSVDQMIRLRNAGATPDFLREISRVSPAWGPEEIVRARNAGLNPVFIQEWVKAGYNLSLDEHIRLRNSGVPVEYARAIGEAGGKPLPVDRLIDLRNKGVSPETVRSLISAGRQ